jgi:hypothetical protein
MSGRSELASEENLVYSRAWAAVSERFYGGQHDMTHNPIAIQVVEWL